MRSIERRFEKEGVKSPQVSSLMHFTRAINKQKFSEQRLIRWFNKLVNIDDYEEEDKKEIVKHLLSINDPEAYQK